jgi:hypothetical protein
MDLWRHHAGQKYSVLGLTISDPELIRRTKNVVIASFALSVLSILTCILEIQATHARSDGRVAQALLGLISSLTAPAFGYLGARRGSATLMCMFVALMVVTAGTAGTFVVALIANIGTIPFSWLLVWYSFLWIFSGIFSAWAAFNGNKLFAKLLEGEQIVDGTPQPGFVDQETVLPEIDTQLPNVNDIGRKRIFSDFDESLPSPSKRIASKE